MEKEHLIKHFLISNLIKKLIMSDIYSDNNKIQKKLGWVRKFDFNSLVVDMVENDLKILKGKKNK